MTIEEEGSERDTVPGQGEEPAATRPTAELRPVRPGPNVRGMMPLEPKEVARKRKGRVNPL